MRGMKHRWSLALLFVIGCATGGVAAQFVVPPVRAGTSPTRWEYQCVTAESKDDGTTSAANKLGAQGWELVSTAPAGWSGTEYGQRTYGYLLCAKRALP